MSVHDQVLWDAVQNDVPALLATVEQMLNDLGFDRGSPA
jgi:hypothetical protein